MGSIPCRGHFATLWQTNIKTWRLRISPSLYCPGRMAELSKSESTGGFNCPEESRWVTLYFGFNLKILESMQIRAQTENCPVTSVTCGFPSSSEGGPSSILGTSGSLSYFLPLNAPDTALAARPYATPAESDLGDIRYLYQSTVVMTNSGLFSLLHGSCQSIPANEAGIPHRIVSECTGAGAAAVSGARGDAPRCASAISCVALTGSPAR